MDNKKTVDAALEDFIAVIKESEKYKEYRAQLELVKQDPELKRQIDDYRKRNFDMQMNDDMDFGMLTRFQDEFKGFRENPLVDSFLAAELDFCKMMQKLNFDLVEAMDFE